MTRCEEQHGGRRQDGAANHSTSRSSTNSSWSVSRSRRWSLSSRSSRSSSLASQAEDNRLLLDERIRIERDSNPWPSASARIKSFVSGTGASFSAASVSRWSASSNQLKNARAYAIFCVALVMVFLLFITDTCPSSVCVPNKSAINEQANRPWLIQTYEPKSRPGNSLKSPEPTLSSLLKNLPRRHANFSVAYDDIAKNKSFRFDIKGDDVLVFLHIQKTGTTALRRLYCDLFYFEYEDLNLISNYIQFS